MSCHSYKNTVTHRNYFCDCCGYPDPADLYSCMENRMRDPAYPFHYGYFNHCSIEDLRLNFDWDTHSIISLQLPSILDLDLCNICYKKALAYLELHPDANAYDFASYIMTSKTTET